MNLFLKIGIFGLWSAAAHGQQQSKEEALKQCHAAYKRHLDKFREPNLIDPNEYNRNYAGFRTLFVDQGVKIYNPLQQQNALVSIETYVQALNALSDGAAVVFDRTLYCRDWTKHNLYYIHFQQSFRGAYTANPKTPLPVVWLTMTVLEQANGFKITSIRKAAPEAATDRDEDGDGVGNRCDKCRTIAGGLEHWGEDPYHPCAGGIRVARNGSKLIDSDGDGTPDVKDKCPNQFGETEDGGCPNYTENELKAIATIEKTRKSKDTFLYLMDARLKRLPSIIKTLTYLKEVSLNNNQICNISVLKELKQLRRLDLRNNQIKDISPLKELKQLKELDLCGNNVKYLSALKDLKQLTILDITDAQIHNVDALQDLKQLTELYLDHNQISDLSPLKELKQLEGLYLTKNQLRDISVLKELKKLKRLWLDLNQIQDISPLKDLKQLTNVTLSNNEIQNFNLELNLFPQLTELRLYGNPIQNLPESILSAEWEYNCLEVLRAYQKKQRK